MSSVAYQEKSAHILVHVISETDVYVVDENDLIITVMNYDNRKSYQLL